MRTAVRSAALLLALASVPVITAAQPASATPCNQSTFHNVWKRDVFVFDKINGEDSFYNKPSSDHATFTVNLTYGREDTHSVTKHWEITASGGADWGVVKADISGTYGEQYTDAATTSASKTLNVTVKDGYTGWIRAVFYRRVIGWTAYTWRWSDEKDACVKRTIQKAYWGDPKVQYVMVTREGHVFPS